MVGVGDTHGMVHVALGNQAVSFRSFVEFKNIVRSDLGFVEDVGNAVGKHGVRIGIAVAVFCLVLVSEVDHRKHIRRVSQRFRNLEVVATVMPSARKVVMDCRTVLQVASPVEMRFRISATLYAEEHERLFEDGIEYGWVNQEVSRGVVPVHDIVFTHRGERGKVRPVQVFPCGSQGILRPEFIFARDGVECAVNPDVGLYDVLLDKRKAAVRNLRFGVRVDNLEGHVRRVGHIGVLVVLGPESALVQSNRTTVEHVERIEVSPTMDLVSAVEVRELGHRLDGENVTQDKCCRQQFFQVRHFHVVFQCNLSIIFFLRA